MAEGKTAQMKDDKHSPPREAVEEVPIQRIEPMREDHPFEPFLRMDRIPHIWCPSCGIGVAVGCFIQAIRRLKIDTSKITITSGIGCTGRVAGYIAADSFHTTHGRALPFATGLALTRPDMTHIVFSGDGDLSAIGGNHLIHAARRNMPLKIFCVNNFIYGMTGGQVTPTTPQTALATTSPYGNFETPFNLPKLMAACGASYVARWTVLHVRRLRAAYEEALQRKGFCFVEAIAPCPTLYARRNRIGDGRDLMSFYHKNSTIEHGADLDSLDIAFQKKIVCGKFIDRERDTFLEAHHKAHVAKLKDKFVPYDPVQAMKLAGYEEKA